jgi:tripartite-type tricarboxylate transporter receptor subunit TctC
MRPNALLLVTLALSLLQVKPVHAQPLPQSDWPTKPLTIVIPYAPGGFSDTRFRLLAKKLSEKLGQAVIIDNKAGGGGVIGTAMVAKAAPDGYTIGCGSFAPLAINPSLMKKMPYEVVSDLAPVILIENSPLILSVAKNLPVKSLAELIALAKKDPGKLTFGSSGLGGAHHLSGEMLRADAKIDIVHVPYKGGAPAATDLMAGHLSFMFEMGYAALPSIRGGLVKAIAVTSTKRLTALPDVPTMIEAGLADYESYNWQGVVVPNKTPVAIIAKLNKAFNEILKDPEVAKAISDVGSQAVGGSPEFFGKFIQTEQEKWARVIKAANISKE